MTTLLGTTLNGRYRLEARIGAGGMSTVYRALDETLQRQVAIKLMNREVATDSDQLERFRREARAVAQLSHPHIVGVIDAGEDEGRPYIVFEYVEGETLKERIRRNGRLPIAEAVAYAIEIARALGAAHARHIVHRDVKPQNVLIDEEGSAKVTDFGIARTLDEEGLTADGRVLGTTDYVSPEQALGQPVTGQSDLYSLGIVLYEMLTGEVPVQGREPGGGRDEARARGAARRAGAPPRGVLGARRRDRHRHRQAPRGPLRRRRRADRRPRGRARDRDRARGQRHRRGRPACCGRCRRGPRRRIPFRMRHRAVAVILLLVVAAVAVGAVVWLATRTHHGTGNLNVKAPSSSSTSGAPLKQVRLCQSCAFGFNPLGSPTNEHPEASLAIDNQLGTAWTTQTYYSGTLNKAGVGLYVDARPMTAARVLRIITTTPGFTATIYARKDQPPLTWPDTGWTKISAPTVVSHKQDIQLTSSEHQVPVLPGVDHEPRGASQLALDEVALYR